MVSLVGGGLVERMGWEPGATRTARNFRFLRRTEDYRSSKKSTSLERNEGFKDPLNFCLNWNIRATTHQLALYSQAPPPQGWRWGGLGISPSLGFLSYEMSTATTTRQGMLWA